MKQKYISIQIEESSGSYICKPEDVMGYLQSDVETLLEEGGIGR